MGNLVQIKSLVYDYCIDIFNNVILDHFIMAPDCNVLSHNNSYLSLTHCGPVMPYSDIELNQHCFR